MKKDTVKELLANALKEIKMWRERELWDMLFVDSEEEKWFEKTLRNQPAGIEHFDEFKELMLKGYRKIKEKNT